MPIKLSLTHLNKTYFLLIFHFQFQIEFSPYKCVTVTRTSLITSLSLYLDIIQNTHISYKRIIIITRVIHSFCPPSLNLFHLPDVGSGSSPVISMCSSRKRCSVTFVGNPCTPWYGIRCSARHSGHFTCFCRCIDDKRDKKEGEIE